MGLATLILGAFIFFYAAMIRKSPPDLHFTSPDMIGDMIGLLGIILMAFSPILDHI